MGLGNAVRIAISKAKKDYFLIYPADGDISLKYIKKYFPHCNPQEILASYFTDNRKRGFIRRCLSSLFNIIYITTFSLPYKYINGPSFYPTKALKKLALKSRRFSIVAEINVRMVQNGLKVKNIAMKRKTFDKGSSALKIKNLIDVIYNYLFLVLNRK